MMCEAVVMTKYLILTRAIGTENNPNFKMSVRKYISGVGHMNDNSCFDIIYDEMSHLEFIAVVRRLTQKCGYSSIPSIKRAIKAYEKHTDEEAEQGYNEFYHSILCYDSNTHYVWEISC